MDEQPHVTEITLIEQTIAFCKSLQPQDAEETKEAKKDIVFNNKDGETVLLTKEARNEEMWMAPSAKKKSKGKKKAASDDSKRPIKHSAETFQLFDKLKLDPPITVADIPGCLEQLDAKMEMYQQKVKDWETNKEAMKAKLLAGE